VQLLKASIICTSVQWKISPLATGQLECLALPTSNYTGLYVCFSIGRRPIFFVTLFMLAVGRCLTVFTASSYPLFLTVTVLGSVSQSAAFQSPLVLGMIWYDVIYLTAIGLTPGGSSRVHIYIQTIYRTAQSIQTIHRKRNSLIGKSADRVPSLRGIFWHLPYKWGKSREKPQSG
jgi:hypothetical protein